MTSFGRSKLKREGKTFSEYNYITVLLWIRYMDQSLPWVNSTQNSYVKNM